jgi:hypothetical protein
VQEARVARFRDLDHLENLVLVLDRGEDLEDPIADLAHVEDSADDMADSGLVPVDLALALMDLVHVENLVPYAMGLAHVEDSGDLTEDLAHAEDSEARMEDSGLDPMGLARVEDSGVIVTDLARIKDSVPGEGSEALVVDSEFRHRVHPGDSHRLHRHSSASAREDGIEFG